MKSKTFFVLVLMVSCLSINAFARGQKDGDGVIKFAGSGGYPPFNFMTESNEVDGFDVDVAKEIASRLDMELEYVTTAWDGIIAGLRAGRYNGVLGSMAITEERLKIVDFSDPYYYSGAQVIVRKDSNIKALSDISSASLIGVVNGTTFVDDVEGMGAQARLYEDDNQTLMELLNGRIDAVISDRVVAVNAINKIKGGKDLVLTGELLRKEKCAIAFQKDDPLTAEVNTILAEMRKDGTLSEISKKWIDGIDITNP
ncbi:ABC transporter substrate-binding protein [Oceanispirochaeta sp.]|jgi:polar amino acid transport system substrate-binding protein|uniref:ABC transporter substrate-binding protein n=1 Tax=Oceanispirochaeta sp. TaxID=2035350 RepID=UPI00260600AB|nr:ABC transporter substrate-binding protein [Oceanispirochaeta sp.]MDA3956743.1 ABC transporter substrate-binding protein [Oceanispirochaeta sp.]